MPLFSMQNVIAILKGKTAIITVILIAVILLALTVFVTRSRTGRNSTLQPTPIGVPSKIPQPTTRMDIFEVEDVFRSANFPIEITVPKSYGKAKVFITDSPRTKGDLNKNGVMELITFENTDVYVGIMQKLFNEEFLVEKDRFNFASNNTTYEFVVSQYVKPTGDVNPELLGRYETRFGKYFIRATNIRNSMQYVTITAPLVTDSKKVIQDMENLIRNIKTSS